MWFGDRSLLETSGASRYSPCFLVGMQTLTLTSDSFQDHELDTRTGMVTSGLVNSHFRSRSVVNCKETSSESVFP